MQFSFDLISDLHTETWPETFDWSGQATSPFCVVAGDIAKDQNQVCHVLKNLSENYQAVFYIDGNDEHKYQMTQLGLSYSNLSQKIKRIKNCVYLQDNVVVINGIAFLAANGWWGFDLDSDIPMEVSRQWWEQDMIKNNYAIDAETVRRMSVVDADYIIKSVKRLQRHNDVKKIVVITHTVPNIEIIKHDISIQGQPKFNVLGNKLMNQALGCDTENKIHTWCFGHYHGPVDQYHNGVRYVNNCRGRGDTLYKQVAYFPKRITID